MDLRHTFTVPVSVEETWSALNDIESVALCFPGAKVTSVEGDTFTGSCKVKLGPIALVYNGTGTFVEKDEDARRMVIDAKGKDKRGNGTAGAHVTATMTEEGSSTRVEVLTELNITGKPAQFGRGVMQDVSDKLLGQFTDCLEQKLVGGQTSGAPSADAGPSESTAGPTSGPTTGPSTGPTAGPTAGPSEPTPDPAPTGGTSTEAPPAGRMHNMRRLDGSGPSAGEQGASRDNEALDLGATVLPVLARTYWKQALGLILVLVVLRRLFRR